MRENNKEQTGYMDKQYLGRWGENTAKAYLINNNVIIVSENFRSKQGEIDLIGWDGECLVFFEVKTRQSQKFGLPEQAVEKNKIAHIVNAGLDYLCKKFIEEPLWRVDIISILRNPKTEDFIIDWIKNAQF